MPIIFLQEQFKKICNLVEVRLQGKLWALKVPLKIRHFLWRAGSGSLPTRFQLFLKDVPLDPVCPFCDVDKESIFHCLVCCSFAKACWLQAGFHFDYMGTETFGGWLDHIFQSFSDADCIKIAMLSWAIWRVRNDLVWKKKTARISNVLFLSTSVLNNWVRVQGPCSDLLAAYMDSRDGALVWRRPLASGVKINVDAALFPEKGLFSIAGIARDSTGSVIPPIS